MWLRADERLRAGYAYLRKLGGKLVVEALYSQHLFDDDLGDVQTGDFEAKMAASHAYAYEALGWTHAGQEHKLRMIRSGTAWEFIGRHTFEERMLRAIVSTGTPAFPHDVERTNVPLDRMLSQKGDSQWLYQHVPPTKDPYAYSKLFVGVQGMREWYMVGRIGYSLLRQKRELPARPHLLLTDGLVHTDLTRKLQLTNATVSETVLPAPGLPERHRRLLPRMLETGEFEPVLITPY